MSDQNPHDPMYVQTIIRNLKGIISGFQRYTQLKNISALSDGELSELYAKAQTAYQTVMEIKTSGMGNNEDVREVLYQAEQILLRVFENIASDLRRRLEEQNKHRDGISKDLQDMLDFIKKYGPNGPIVLPEEEIDKFRG